MKKLIHWTGLCSHRNIKESPLIWTHCAAFLASCQTFKKHCKLFGFFFVKCTLLYNKPHQYLYIVYSSFTFLLLCKIYPIALKEIHLKFMCLHLKNKGTPDIENAFSVVRGQIPWYKYQFFENRTQLLPNGS